MIKLLANVCHCHSLTAYHCCFTEPTEVMARGRLATLWILDFTLHRPSLSALYSLPSSPPPLRSGPLGTVRESKEALSSQTEIDFYAVWHVKCTPVLVSLFGGQNVCITALKSDIWWHQVSY